MLNGENPLYRDFPHASFETEGGVAKIQKPDGTTYFTYNDANLVESIHYSDDSWSYFHYDGKLRRHAIQDDEFGLSYFTWDQNGVNLLAERNESGTVTARYTHGYTPVEGIGSMVKAERVEGGCTYYQYPVYDHRGTIHKLVDRSGAEVGNYVYNAFGQILDQSNPPEGNRFKYQTNWMALKEDLYLSPSRVYSGELGRFLQKDPLPAVRERGKLGVYQNSVFKRVMIYDVVLPSVGPYTYISNNPLSLIDILGLKGLAPPVPIMPIPPLPYSPKKNIGIKTTSGPKGTGCGQFEWAVNFVLNYVTPKKGPIYQHIIFDVDTRNCSGAPITCSSYGYSQKHWDFWEGVGWFQAGWSVGGQDSWGIPECDKCTKGVITIDGEAFFYEGALGAYNMSPGGIGSASPVGPWNPSSWSAPYYPWWEWLLSIDRRGPCRRNAKIEWNCCVSPNTLNVAVAEAGCATLHMIPA